MAYGVKRTNDMKMRSSDLALGGNGLTGDFKLMLLRFEIKKLLEFPRDPIFKLRFLRSFDRLQITNYSCRITVLKNYFFQNLAFWVHCAKLTFD